MHYKAFTAAGLVATTFMGCAAPLPPSIDANDVVAAGVENARVAGLTDTVTMPTTGSANYSGTIGGIFASGADLDGGFQGSIGMDVDFANSSLTGSVTELNLVSTAGAPSQLLTGTLDMTGSFTSAGALTATASGDVGGVVSGFSGTSNLSVDLVGQFKDDTGTADAVSGTISGSDLSSGQFSLTQN